MTLAKDGTLESIYFDNGGYAVSSVQNISDSSYAPYVVAIDGKLAVTNILALNSHMQ
ncbi:MAG TPA: hypothetical protein PLV58_11190 [Campylobacterales bacterium]|nr:hypothetical protein [Campylobacterales bacterium]